MRKIIFISIIILAYTNCYAQSTRRDTIFYWTDDTNNPRHILHAPVLENQSSVQTITPQSGLLCFDKKMRIKTNTSGRIIESCIFINSTKGFTGMSIDRSGENANCTINNEEEDFTFIVKGLGGNIYNYMNRKKRNTIQKVVTTGQTDTKYYTLRDGIPNAPLRKKRTSRIYCNNRIVAYEYKIDGKDEVYFLYGKITPQNIILSPTKHVGEFGLGYYETDKGLFIIMEVESNSYTAKIEWMEDKEHCFDTSPYATFEENYEQQMTRSIQTKQEKLNRTIVTDGSCGFYLSQKLDYEKYALREQQQNIQIGKTQNDYQASNDIKKSKANAFMNFDDMIEMRILDMKYKICKKETKVVSMPTQTSAQSAHREQEQSRLNCMRRQLTDLESAKIEMQGLDRNHTSQPYRAWAQKAQLLMDARPCE